MEWVLPVPHCDKHLAIKGGLNGVKIIVYILGPGKLRTVIPASRLFADPTNVCGVRGVRSVELQKSMRVSFFAFG